MAKELRYTGERLVPTVYDAVAAEHLARYAFALDFCDGKKVLDAACGEGYGSFLLAKKASLLIGVDIDKSTIQHAEKKYNRPNLQFIDADVQHLPFPDEMFDIVVSFETLEHVPDHHTFIKEIKRVLKNDGLLILSTPDKQHYSLAKDYNNPFHQKELLRVELEQLLQRFFQHYRLLAQQNLCGSLLYPENISGTVNCYEGSYTILSESLLLEKPLYYLTVASNISLPETSILFFDGSALLQQKLENLERNYKASWSFKIGRTITWPVRFIRNIININR